MNVHHLNSIPELFSPQDKCGIMYISEIHGGLSNLEVLGFGVETVLTSAGSERSVYRRDIIL